MSPGASLNELYAREVQPGHGGFTWGLALASVVVATVVLILRIWSRLLNRSQRFGSDDWMAVAAWPFVVGQGLAMMFCMRWGVGLHIDELNNEEFMKSNQLLLTILIMYCFNIAFIRISVSLYYRRIFASSKRFKMFVWANIAINLAWLVSIMFAAIFQCTSPKAMWDKTVTGVKCSPPIEHQHICSFSSVILDLMALILPLPMIWKLQLKPAKKWEILSIFFLGYCVPVLTIGRLISTLKTGDALNQDPTWAFTNIIYWLLLETTTAFVGVCMPSVLFLARRWRAAGFHALFNPRAAPRKSDLAYSWPSKNSGTSSGNHSEIRKGGPLFPSATRDSEEEAIRSREDFKPDMHIVQTTSYSVTSNPISYLQDDERIAKDTRDRVQHYMK